jgi:UDP-glucose:(heptosyl)LPS alpha-1,3-glucosyltransferase
MEAAATVARQVSAATAGRRMLRVDPFHAGNLWRDCSFARAPVAWRRAPGPGAAAERIPGCDIHRAGDGVRALARRRRCRAA